MELKRCENILWTDLPRVESPSLGLIWARNTLHTNNSNSSTLIWIQGLQEALLDPYAPNNSEWNTHARDSLLSNIEKGAVLVLQQTGDKAQQPLFHLKTDPVTKKDDWVIGADAGMGVGIRHFGEIALHAARNTSGRIDAPLLHTTKKQPPPKPTPESKPVRNLTIKHMYHDDEPVQGARFIAKLSDGSIREGATDTSGNAVLNGIPRGRVRIQFEPDSRPYERVDQTANPRFGQDIDTVINRYAADYTNEGKPA